MLGIEYIRSQLGMSITDLAKKLSVSRQIVSKWEKGEKKIPDKRLGELSKICGVPEKYFSRELDFTDRINITSLINREKNEIAYSEECLGEVERLVELFSNEDFQEIKTVCEKDEKKYIEIINYCKEKITVAQRKLVMDISMCENMARNNNSYEGLKKMFYYSQLYSALTEILLTEPEKIRVVANVLNELIKEKKDD